ncbi:hypothetical protein HN481_02855 [Candidatus Parcubacteria bacterium]|nr:hypothetical protein [Candidatus Parcubacteria bacterium]
MMLIASRVSFYESVDTCRIVIDNYHVLESSETRVFYGDVEFSFDNPETDEFEMAEFTVYPGSQRRFEIRCDILGEMEQDDEFIVGFQNVDDILAYTHEYSLYTGEYDPQTVLVNVTPNQWSYIRRY